MRRFKVEKEGLPDLAGMMLVTVEALKEMGGSASIDELDEKVIELENIPDEEQALVMANESGRPRVNYYLAWARTYLKRGGAVENSSRGVWSLTPTGHRITSRSETEAIHEQVSREERGGPSSRGSNQKVNPLVSQRTCRTRSKPRRQMLAVRTKSTGKHNFWRFWVKWTRAHLNAFLNDSCANPGSPRLRCEERPAMAG
ncbi:MAG: winged helix-turn-helix domain-containing protein [Rhodobacter sp.]|nr:winged helix-turn-helix domain-containing protein [Rhodobacter sp.]